MRRMGHSLEPVCSSAVLTVDGNMFKRMRVPRSSIQQKMAENARYLSERRTLTGNLITQSQSGGLL
jgi:hypothetical protein